MRATLRRLPVLGSLLERLADDGRPLLNRFVGPPRFEDEPMSETAAIQQVDAHDFLLRRHGVSGLLDHYERHVWPTLAAAPPRTVEDAKRQGIASPRTLDRARLQIVQNAADIAVRFGFLDTAVTWGERGLASIGNATLADAPGETIAARRVARRDVAAGMRRVAAAARHADKHTAIRALRLVDDFRELRDEDRDEYARLLWETGARGPDALRAYVGAAGAAHAGDGAAAANPALFPAGRFVLEAMAITEETPVDLIADRLRFNHAWLIRPGDGVDALRNLGMGHLRLDGPQKALPYLKRAAQLGTASGSDAFYLGQAHFRLEQFTEASAAFSRAEALGFGKAKIAAWQALSLGKSGRYEEATAHFLASEAQLGTAHLTSEFFVYWGRTNYLQGRLDDAEIRFRRALDLDGGEWRAVSGLAICLDENGRAAEARALLRAHLDAHRADDLPPAPAYLLGRFLHADRALADAVRYYRAAVRAQPDDPQYLLALAIALDDQEALDAGAALARVAETSAANAEVFRRLYLWHSRAGDRTQARAWLDRLARARPGDDQVHAIAARDLVSRAIEACHGAQYADAYLLAARIEGSLDGDPFVRKLRAQALACDAWMRLRGLSPGRIELTGIERQIRDARELEALPETEFLDAFLQLMTGAPAPARDAFQQLAARDPERRDVVVFGILAQCLLDAGAGHDDAAGATLITRASEVPEIAAFTTFFLAHTAARAGNIESAAAHFRVWAADAASVQRLALPRHLVNEFAAACLRAAAERPAQAQRWLAEIAAAHGDGYWGLASTLIKHHELVKRGTADATDAKIAQCDEAYLELLTAPSDEASATIARHYAEWLQFVALVCLERHDTAALLSTLAEMVKLPIALPAAVQRLRDEVERRLAVASHEAAYALVWREPDRARALWSTMLAAQPNDLDTLHHLACLCWTRAHDEILAERWTQSLPFWRDGLDYYRRLYASGDHWTALLAKGRSLVQPGKPFDEEAFAKWRGDAFPLKARTLIDLILHVLAQAGDRGVMPAAGLFKIIRNSGLDDEDVDGLSEELAARRLDPDPTALPDFALAKARAEELIAIDAENVRARVFLLRAVAFRVHLAYAEGDQNLAGLLQQLQPCEAHARWLEARLGAQNGRRDDLAHTIVAYYDEVVELQHQQGQRAITEVNEAVVRLQSTSDIHTKLSARTQLEQQLLRVREAYRASDAAAVKAAALDPASFKAVRHREDHRAVLETTDSLLARFR